MYDDRYLAAYDTPDVIHQTLSDRRQKLVDVYRKVSNSLITWDRILTAVSQPPSYIITILTPWKTDAVGIDLAKAVREKFNAVDNKYREWISDYAALKDAPTDDETSLNNLKILLKAGEQLTDEFAKMASIMGATKTDAVLMAVGPYLFAVKRVTQISWSFMRPAARAVAVTGERVYEKVEPVIEEAKEAIVRQVKLTSFILRNAVPIAIVTAGVWLFWPRIAAFTKSKASKISGRRFA